MKRQNVLIVLGLVAALAVAFFLLKPAAPEVASVPSEKDDLVEEKKEAVEAPKDPVAPAAEAPVNTQTAEETAPEASDEGDAGSQEQVAKSIKQNLAGARAILQQKAALEKAKPEEIHHMPKQTLDAAKRLGEIAELEAQHPEQAETFREFYLECARDENTITVTRAQCVDKYIKASKLDAAGQKQFLSEFPDEIVRLVEALQ